MIKKLIVILCFVVLLSSCTTTEKVVFDESVPLEESAWIIGAGVGTIVGYNDISVNWNLGLTGMARIPAGDTLLEWNIDGYVNARKIKGEGIVMQYKFQPEKKYFVRIRRQDNAYGLDIYEYGIDENLPLSNEEFENHFVDFAPFLNIEGNGETTVLN